MCDFFPAATYCVYLAAVRHMYTVMKENIYQSLHQEDNRETYSFVYILWIKAERNQDR